MRYKLLFVFFVSFAFMQCKKDEVVPNLFVEKVFSATQPLNAVCFTDEMHGYVAGNDGTILQTFDGGNSWTQVSVGPNVDAQFSCISFPSKDTGWISGYPNQSGFIRASAMFSTFDGGISWQYRGALSNMQFTHFPTNNVGYEDEYNMNLYKTTDGGNTWNELFFAPNPGFSYHNLFFVNKDTGFVGCDYGEYRTINGGNSWSLMTMPSSQSQYSGVSSYAFADERNGVAVFTRGSIDITLNGGMTWQNSFTAMNNNYYPLNTVCMPSSSVMLAGGINYLFVSVDGGSSWKQYFQTDGTSFPGEIRGISFYDAYNGYAVTAEGGIYRLRRVDEKN